MSKRRRLPTLNWLRTFEAAARHGSFTGAAEELGVTPAAISQQVKQLEDWLGTPLFTRLPRGLVLTDAGLGYLPMVRHAFDHLAAGTEDLFGETRGGPVSVRVTTSLTHAWLVPRLAGFFAAHPDISLRLTTTVDGLDFGQEGVDLEVRYGDGKWPGTRTERLFREELFPVCAPSLLEGGAPLEAPEDLAHHTMIHVIGEPENWRMWLQAAGATAVTARHGLQFDLHMMSAQAAISGIGVALGLSPVVADALADGRLVAPFATRIPARDAHFVVTPEDAADRAEAQAFRTWLIAEARGEGARGANKKPGRRQRGAGK
jgi:LysR family glycine cleavage system transcriptional activator